MHLDFPVDARTFTSRWNEFDTQSSSTFIRAVYVLEIKLASVGCVLGCPEGQSGKENFSRFPLGRVYRSELARLLLVS